jgi:hypothetical protein
MAQRRWEAKCLCFNTRKKCLWKKSKCSSIRILRTLSKLTLASTSNQIQMPEGYKVSFQFRVKKAPRSQWVGKSINHHKECKSRLITSLYNTLQWNKKYLIPLCSTQAQGRNSNSLKGLKTQRYNRASDYLCRILCRLSKMFRNQQWA